MRKVLIFSGTTEGRELAEKLSGLPLQLYVSVATEFGKTCMGDVQGAQVLCGRMDREEMTRCLRRLEVDLVIDATHPFAAEATENIRGACEQCRVPYIRCLRDEEEYADADGIVRVKSVQEAVEYLKRTEGKILITTGSKELQLYTEIADYGNRCYARILPGAESEDRCRALGFAEDHVIAGRGPFTEEENRELLDWTQARYFVTKESGKAGGFQEKREAAARRGAVLVVVERPKEEGWSGEQVWKRIVRDEKERQRREIRKRIAALGAEYCRAADEAIRGKLISLREFQEAGCIFCFVGAGWEIDTVPLIRTALRMGKRVAVPRCVGEGEMEAYEITSLEELRPGRYGIAEPEPSCRPVSAAEIDLAILPCLSCDAEGRRLGHGGGYYDRYLAGTDFVTAAVCRKKLLLEKVCTEPHDRRADLVVTEEEIFFCFEA